MRRDRSGPGERGPDRVLAVGGAGGGAWEGELRAH